MVNSMTEVGFEPGHLAMQSDTLHVPLCGVAPHSLEGKNIPENVRVGLAEAKINDHAKYT